MICKWETDCARCGTRIEEGDELFLVKNLFDEREKLCSVCAQIDGLICNCGNQKKQEHATCWNCKVEQEQQDGKRCACGNYKKLEYPTCYSCKQQA